VSFNNNQFGLLTIISSPRPDVFKCRCRCGNVVEVWRSQLANNVVRHCGCRDNRKLALQKRKPHITLHFRTTVLRSGRRKKLFSGELNSYISMKGRCYSKDKHGVHVYENWGGKGIRVCDRWLEPNGEGFQNFLDDMGPRPSHTTLDRINPQDHYTPMNCQWGTPKEQGFHKTNILWKEESPPPIPSIRDTNEQVDDIFGHEPY
jgi:hypothetical protein